MTLSLHPRLELLHDIIDRVDLPFFERFQDLFGPAPIWYVRIGTDTLHAAIHDDIETRRDVIESVDLLVPRDRLDGQNVRKLQEILLTQLIDVLELLL